VHIHLNMHMQVKEEVQSMLQRHVNDQVAEAVLEHKGASSLLAWFDSGKGKVSVGAVV
jgi:hypothetical protein